MNAYNDQRVQSPEDIVRNYEAMIRVVEGKAREIAGQGSIGHVSHVMRTLGSPIYSAADPDMRNLLPRMIDRARENYELAGMYARALEDPDTLIAEISNKDTTVEGNVDDIVKRLFRKVVPPSERRSPQLAA